MKNLLLLAAYAAFFSPIAFAEAPSFTQTNIEIQKATTVFIPCDQSITTFEQLKMICQDMQGKQDVGVWVCGEIYYMQVNCDRLKQ